ncbi:linear amide C-N hydrolase [Nocardia sp. CT2-14]|uniref:Linear amide C-N hydrolase n=2 Tax=Nocardia aurantiaca TaxID=2675850 RepID=A0A6I3L510_9NOCA|nr:linear amide C-N hydrolase [Nocardia aurantiaca]
MQYFLDQFTSVDELVRDLAANPVHVRPVSAQGEVSTIHLAFEDTSGDSAIIEHVNGKPRVHHDRRSG